MKILCFVAPRLRCQILVCAHQHEDVMIGSVFRIISPLCGNTTISNGDSSYNGSIVRSFSVLFVVTTSNRDCQGLWILLETNGQALTGFVSLFPYQLGNRSHILILHIVKNLRQISWSLEPTKSDISMIVSLGNLTCFSAALLPMCQSNFRVIGKV